MKSKKGLKPGSRVQNIRSKEIGFLVADPTNPKKLHKAGDGFLCVEMRPSAWSEEVLNAGALLTDSCVLKRYWRMSNIELANGGGM